MPKKEFFPENPIKPSDVNYKDFLFYRPWDKSDESGGSSDVSDESSEEDKENISDDEETFCGKWMLFYDSKDIYIARGMNQHDYMWQFAIALVDDYKNTGIKLACSSTSYETCFKDYDRENGVICLFTEDYTDKRAVKKAADCIRSIMYYDRDMFYKTDEATRAGKYRCFGEKFVSMYKHTPNNKLYVRDDIDPYLWNRVEFDV